MRGKEGGTDTVHSEKASHVFKPFFPKDGNTQLDMLPTMRKHRTTQTTLPDSVDMRDEVQRKWHSFSSK